MSTPRAHANLPLFPLETVLFPGGLLPLRIFEVRYLHMVEQCRKDGTPFGIVSLMQGSEVRRPGAQSGLFHPVGTLARITHFEAPQPGLMEIDCLGTERFRINSSRQLAHGQWVADVELLNDDVATPIPSDLAHASHILGQLVQTLREQHVAENRFPILLPMQLDDCGWVANRWCEMLPLSVQLKHNLLALDSPLVRLELVSDVLAKAHPSPQRPE
ncbi:LON peptidase substrate-binding domain-containing protein [Rhodoferax sp.]|uniref:LON peptidase substrate-binding domain-containing protein n=1 Tax=Rhodoferax sp. TaxID=50421 RepID=UPI0025E74FA4|nr:LON peptidase substrate-binding domain-containing protein [Rhodoferax sp.]